MACIGWPKDSNHPFIFILLSEVGSRRMAQEHIERPQEEEEIDAEQKDVRLSLLKLLPL